MIGFVISRLIQAAITVFVISLVVFFLVRLGGDPISVMAPPTMSIEQVAELRRAWGFDQPLVLQYLTFLRKAFTGDFGTSIQQGIPAMELVMDRLRWTYALAGVSAVIALVVALPLGVLSAVRRNSLLDLFCTLLATLGNAMPSFWLGLMLILVFSVMLRMLPAFGSESAAAFIMPSVTLGIGAAARLSRLTRSAMLDVLAQDYVRTAYSKGLAGRTVIWGHALRNALIPVTTVAGLQLGWLLGGAVVVESVFAWPGLGRLMVDAIQVRDITVVQAGLLWFSTSFVLINLGIDLMYTVIDPRIRYD